MPITIENPSPKNHEGRRHILADDGVREAYHDVKKIRLRGAASAAGVISPESARAAREQALEDVGTYHIPIDSESPKL
jgi:hypothetical protein